ncbi:MAG: phosphate ABC transporter substrate-binding protein PstS [Acidimicrobiales bacterium]|nr:phosphate ABC transporter substrate-binding protein PstS [Acidimicrobiales bacterium]
MQSMRLVRFLAVVTVMVSGALLGSGCGNSRAKASDPIAVPSGPMTELAKQVPGRIKGAGASFPDAFYQEAVAGLRQVATKLSVTYEAVGSAAGREAFGQGLSDFAGTDSLVGEDDPIAAGTFRYIPTVAASIAVVVNLPGVTDLRLTPEALAGIFQGDIGRWNDPAITASNPGQELPDREIVVARRADGSGTTKNFTRYLDRAADNWRLGGDDTVEWPSHTQGGQQNSGVAQIVIDTAGAIGYVDYGNAAQLGLTMAAIRNRAGRFVAPSIAATQAAIDSSELTEELTYDPLDAPGADAYPITAPTYLLVRSSYDDATTGRAVVTFVRWLVTEAADTYAADLGFAPLPERFRTAALSALDQIQIDPR